MTKSEITVAVVAVSLSVVVSVWTGRAAAEGAVAVGVAPDGVQHGYAIGFALNAANEAAARATAVKACKKSTGSNAAAYSNCHAVATFNNQCAASALDPKNGTPGAGWGVGDTQSDADALALERCRNTAGSSRRQFCVVEDRHCDGTAK
jgi:hypothetical protein